MLFAYWDQKRNITINRINIDHGSPVPERVLMNYSASSHEDNVGSENEERGEAAKGKARGVTIKPRIYKKTQI